MNDPYSSIGSTLHPGKSAGGRRDVGVRVTPVRDKLLLVGAERLSDEELLALVLGAGAGGRRGRGPGGEPRCSELTPGPLALARSVLDRAGGARALAAMEPAELARHPGLGPARASRLAAALALGRRANAPVLSRGTPIHGPQDVFEHFRAPMAGLAQEVFYVLMLDIKNRCLRVKQVSVGTLSASLVHPREVFRSAVKIAAHSVIVCHNHPSGDPSPSREDREITERLERCGRLLGIRLLDHVIVGESTFVNLGTGRVTRPDPTGPPAYRSPRSGVPPRAAACPHEAPPI